MKVYEYCVVYIPTAREKKDGAIAEIIIKPNVLLADKESTASLKAAREIPEKYVNKLDQVEIKIRPF